MEGIKVTKILKGGSMKKKGILYNEIDDKKEL